MCDKEECYRLHVHESQENKVIKVCDFPDLELVYLSGKVSLCGSQFGGKMKCFWEGDVSVTLLANGKEITLNDHDSRQNKEPQRVGEFSFLGKSSLVLNKSHDQVYLLFTICGHPPPPLVTTIVRKLEQPFLIELEENRTTGYGWRLELPNNLTLLHDTFALPHSAEDQVGVGGTRTFVLVGKKRGSSQIRAIYERPWEKETPSESNVKIYKIEIV